MAVYACTVTPNSPTPKKFLGFFGIGILFGKADITNYNSVVAEVTGITKYFKGTPVVVCSGVALGAVKELVAWVRADKAFKCYVPTTGAEVANDVNVGVVEFIAIGFM